VLTVHHLNQSRSQRVLWLLEELGTPYELVRYTRDPATGLAPEALQKIHPLGKSPVITDDGNTVAESGAILEYIVDKYGGGRLVPRPGTPDYLAYRYFMHYAEGSLMPYLLLRLVLGRVRTRAPLLIRPVARAIAGRIDGQLVGPNLARHAAFLDGVLAKSEWFAGAELTCADVQMLFPMEAIAVRVPDATARIRAWVERVRGRPAYQRAVERGGPYEIMA
jgi:glutathione S-transferase